MTMRCGESPLAENLITRQGLEEALETQVIHGGRLGTNLVEMGLLSEKDLARVLGKQHNIAFSSGDMTPELQILQKLGANYADSKDIMPMREDATRVFVAVINPR